MQLVTVATYDHTFQADLAVALLNDAGIPARQRGTFVHGLSSIFSSKSGGISVEVPEDRGDEARELLAAAEQDQGDFVEEEE